MRCNFEMNSIVLEKELWFLKSNEVLDSNVRSGDGREIGQNLLASHGGILQSKYEIEQQMIDASQERLEYHSLLKM